MISTSIAFISWIEYTYKLFIQFDEAPIAIP